MIRGELAKAKDKLRDAKNELGLVSIESQQKILENQIGLIETERTRVKDALTALAVDRIAATKPVVYDSPEPTGCNRWSLVCRNLRLHPIPDSRRAVHRLPSVSERLLVG